jgi:hypothetical protein
MRSQFMQGAVVMGIKKGFMARTTGKGSALVVSFVAIIAIVALVVLMYNFMSNQPAQSPTINLEAPKAPDVIKVPAPEMPKLPTE